MSRSPRRSRSVINIGARLSETLRSVVDAIAAGVRNLPTDIEVQPVSNAVRSVLAVLPPGEAPPCGEAQPAARP